jgi:hypothetical protein
MTAAVDTFPSLTEFGALRILEFAHRHRLTVDAAVEALQVAREIVLSLSVSVAGTNSIERFVADCVEPGEGEIRGSAIYAAYCSWCQRMGEKPVSIQRFGAALPRLGIQKSRGRSVKYHGIKVEL